MVEGLLILNVIKFIFKIFMFLLNCDYSVWYLDNFKVI